MMMSARVWRGWTTYRDVVLVLSCTSAVLAGLALAESPWFLGPARLGLGLVYVLFVPGYCLSVAVWPAEAELDPLERVGLSLGLSIAMIPILALGLDRLGWGLRLWPIALAEC